MRVFGFDVGTTSIGSAAIEIDEAGLRGHILAVRLHPGLSVRIFPEARDPDGTPLNQQRRAKRMARRQLRRRKERRRSLNQLLAQAGLLPSFGTPAWDKAMALDPYALRRRGLTEPLTPTELGRALYHLAKRRHFKGRELEETEEATEPVKKSAEKDEQETRNASAATHNLLKADNKTLGALLAERELPERRRGTHALREDVADEFETLWTAQSAHHPDLRGETLKAQISDTIFSQRPVFWRKNTLGQCHLIPGGELCPKGSWLSQQRRMLEKLNNLAIAGGNARPLDAQERATLLTKLQMQASMSWSAVRKALEPLFKARGESARSIKFNLEVGGDSKLLGNPLEAKLAHIFGADWGDHPCKEDIRGKVPAKLWAADYGEIGTQRVVIRSEQERRARRAAVLRELIEEFEISREQAQALADLKLPQGWEPYSTKALEVILTELEKGERFGTLISSPERKWAEWRNANFPNRELPTGEVHDRLPSPTKKHPDELRRIARLRNPTVVRVQNELRKVVNNLIALYGKPDLIRIELARDVGKSKREREEISDALRKQERRRKAADADLKSKGIANPSRDDIEKWLLWKESQERCPYSGLQIGFDDLFRNGVFEVEHIWPLPVSLDNSFRNKTLCHREWNQRKGKRTPYEAFGHTEDWAAMKDRLDKLSTSKGGTMPESKVKRFTAESIPDDFANRQLTDTSYAARQSVAFLKKLWPDLGPQAPVTVQPVSGRVTAQLRKRWGLNNILSDDGEKTRADHRHHAIDALAVACANPGFVKRLSDYYREEQRGLRPHLPEPWPSIRSDAAEAVGKILVSHRVHRKVSGPLHDEMPSGYTNRDITKNGTVLGIFVKRMPVEKLGLETLRIARVEDISRTAKFVVCDGAVRQALLAHLEAANVPAAKAYPPYPRVTPNGPEIRKVRVLSTQQKGLMVPVMNGFADPANNHHMTVWRSTDGKVNFRTVTLYEAAKRLSNKKDVIQRSREGDWVFVMSLAVGDAVEIPEGEKKGIWIVQGMWANGQVVLIRHNDARPTSKKEAQRLGVAGTREEFLPNVAGLVQRKARKISIDPIGRLHPAND